MDQGAWPAYNPQEIEPRWRKHWEESSLYLTREGGDKPKYYCLDFFPYPSGDGLHVGHCRNYVPTDVLSRYHRMQGYNVLHPMGWDSFGEPTEQAAIAHGAQPRRTTDLNTANFRRQMTLIGASYDWTREIDSSRPEYYRWTQWFFLLLYRRGLAYRDSNYQWWCPICQTTLSSHEAAGGVCWRGHTGITKREIPAWYFKITAYADALLGGLEHIDWPESVKNIQRNWIGRSEGVEIHFPVAGGEQDIPVFTTRPDTLFGATFFVLAPEHPAVQALTGEDQRRSVEAYVAEASQRSEIDRMAQTQPKTGVFTGGYVLNPLNREPIPVWVADYVLPDYGTGAVMGVPAHDERDFEFARANHLPVRVVIVERGWAGEALEQAFTGTGVMVNSGEFDGLPNETGAQRIAQELARRGAGHPAVNYRMRDWLISRQRYWGTPIPIVYCQDCGEVPLPEDQLPLLLPEMEDFTPDGSGRSPLARVPEFVNTTCPKCGGPAERETDTLGGFACSSWYFLRFTSPHYQEGPFEPQAMRYWMPVDLYMGGVEHAVLHLLYARFWTHVLADAGLVPFSEPFPHLRNQGQLLAPDGQRMSKSRGNVITPDRMVEEYGADALRLYVMFMAPYDQDIAWNMEGINGTRRFLNRIWDLYAHTYTASHQRTAGDRDRELERALHQTIRLVGERIQELRLNTMVSALMEFSNQLLERYRSGRWHSQTYREALDSFMVLLAPAAPYLAEELWQRSGQAGSVHAQPWPQWDPALAREQLAQVAVQIDGKLREVIEAALDTDRESLEQQVYALPKIQQHLQGKQVVRAIYVPGRIFNIVTG
jgi:leucyl-tRNA synthetase